MEAHENLASYRRCVDRVRDSWQAFQAKRLERLRERERFGHAAERATENILEDLLLTRLGIKHLVVEAKRPGGLAWNRRAVEAALDQACRYATEQKVSCLAVSDGVMLYAADLRGGGLSDRVFCSLEAREPQEALWWLSPDGIYRQPNDRSDAVLRLLPEEGLEEAAVLQDPCDSLLHPKYKLPARCFAYVGDATEPRTWHLPYLTDAGAVDGRRLPKAVQAILTNYRGAQVRGIPEAAIPDVLVRLGQAARSAGRLPPQAVHPAHVYVSLIEALTQLDRLQDV